MRLDRLSSPPSHDDVVSLLVDFGEIEAAVADALQRDADDELPELTPWRQALCAVALAVCASWHDDRRRLQRALADLKLHVSTLAAVRQPSRVDARVAEGFAQYGLFPEQYIAAAERFAHETRPARVMCVGIRSIGSALAAIVAGALESASVPAVVRTVRPRGHPWARRLAITDAFANALTQSDASHYAVVDEGPGISGSSFAAVVDALTRLGVARDRIVLFPSWRAAPASLRSARAQAVWSTHRQVVASFEDTWIASGRLGDPQSLTDLSAGRWRRIAVGDDESGWPAVQPQHERRKYLRSGRLLRFAGLGRHGAAKLARAETLASRGFTPRATGLAHGFLEREWIAGCPRRSLDGAAVATRIAEYLAFVRSAFSLADAARVDDLIEMTSVNAAEAGLDVATDAAALAAVHDAPAVAVDGRLLPHEWLDSRGTLLKVDALDHHADDFLPGCRDIAWDVAGALVEGDFDDSVGGLLVSHYATRSGDASIAERLPFYLTAYAAYRLGYVTMAAETLGGTPDGERFSRSATRYRRLLAGPAPRRR